MRKQADDHVCLAGSEAAKQQRPQVADAEEKKSQISADSGLSVMSGSQVCWWSCFDRNLLLIIESLRSGVVLLLLFVLYVFNVLAASPWCQSAHSKQMPLTVSFYF